MAFFSCLYTAALHTGNGHSDMDRIFKIIGHPGSDYKTFSKHERIVGLKIEKVADDSCLEASEIERRITFQNVDELKKFL